MCAANISRDKIPRRHCSPPINSPTHGLWGVKFRAEMFSEVRLIPPVNNVTIETSEPIVLSAVQHNSFLSSFAPPPGLCFTEPAVGDA